MSYTALALIAVAVAILIDMAILRTRLLRRKAFWTAYAIIVCFQLVVNGLLTGLRIVRYDPDTIIGLRIAYEPVEDLLFGFAMIVLTLSLWVSWGRWSVHRAARSRSRAGR